LRVSRTFGYLASTSLFNYPVWLLRGVKPPLRQLYLERYVAEGGFVDIYFFCESVGR
jgi:hypothetical protein